MLQIKVLFIITLRKKQQAVCGNFRYSDYYPLTLFSVVSAISLHSTNQNLQGHADHYYNNSANDGGSRTTFGIPVEALCPLLFAGIPFCLRTTSVIDGEQTADPTAAKGRKDRTT